MSACVRAWSCSGSALSSFNMRTARGWRLRSRANLPLRSHERVGNGVIIVIYYTIIVIVVIIACSRTPADRTYRYYFRRTTDSHNTRSDIPYPPRPSSGTLGTRSWTTTRVTVSPPPPCIRHVQTNNDIERALYYYWVRIPRYTVPIPKHCFGNTIRVNSILKFNFRPIRFHTALLAPTAMPTCFVSLPRSHLPSRSWYYLCNTLWTDISYYCCWSFYRWLLLFLLSSSF